ncbi:MAG TPA: deoxyribose-phosphate aldolase [Gemmatimonadaceae bacterium]|nr:deoxyribose-phosphate aldolase [Gemmatimonadaceae bacterium]
MSTNPIDLDALAARVARELARADQSGAAMSGRALTAAPAAMPHSSASGDGAPSAGVRYVRDNARIAEFIDHTLLKAETTAAEVEKLCAEAVENEFAAVCVNPVWVPLCAQRLRGSRVALATVVGFPLGANQPEMKAAEAALAIRQGATEVDMVAAIGHIKSGDWNHVADDIAAVVRASAGTLVKVIIESAHLTPVEIIKASAIAREAGAQYVKTSTGFHAAGGASAEAVALMRLVVGDTMGVKASGGVRDCSTALRMIANGATRIGTSSGVQMAQCLGRGPLPMRELLASPQVHADRCASGACATSDAKSSGASVY